MRQREGVTHTAVVQLINGLRAVPANSRKRLRSGSVRNSLGIAKHVNLSVIESTPGNTQSCEDTQLPRAKAREWLGTWHERAPIGTWVTKLRFIFLDGNEVVVESWMIPEPDSRSMETL